MIVIVNIIFVLIILVLILDLLKLKNDWEIQNAQIDKLRTEHRKEKKELFDIIAKLEADLDEAKEKLKSKEKKKNGRKKQKIK